MMYKNELKLRALTRQQAKTWGNLTPKVALWRTPWEALWSRPIQLGIGKMAAARSKIRTR